MKNINNKERESQVLDYLKKQMSLENYPSYKELNKKFNLTYFKIDWKKLYLSLGINFLRFPLKRPAGCQEILKKELIDYVKNEINKNHYPSRREIEKKFRVRIGDLFGNIENLYNQAQSKYVQKNNQFLKRQKAELFLEITKDILEEFNLKLVKFRKAQEQGIDIIAENMENEKVGIELKAYNKYEMVKTKNIEQLRKSLQKENINKGILITTTSRIQKNLKISSNIRIILFDEFSKICKPEMESILNFIRNYSIHIETREKEAKRNEIIEFMRKEFARGNRISIVNINNNFKIDFYSYFESFYEAIEKAAIDLEPKEIRYINNKEQRERAKQILIDKILNFIEAETKKGYYPTAEDIKKNFRVSHIWNFIKMSDLYKKLGLLPYLERKQRIRKVI
jgi:hypothetical protein